MSREAMKHTLGPWVADPAVRQSFTVYAPKEGFIVGTQDEEGRFGAIESKANARLIAAAPDLLEALKMVRDADDDCKRDGLPTIPPAARATIDAAIAKATGGGI